MGHIRHRGERQPGYEVPKPPEDLSGCILEREPARPAGTDGP